jgi:hypothetical protein
MFDEFIRWSDDGLFGVVPDKQEVGWRSCVETDTQFVGSPGWLPLTLHI